MTVRTREGGGVYDSDTLVARSTTDFLEREASMKSANGERVIGQGSLSRPNPNLKLTDPGPMFPVIRSGIGTDESRQKPKKAYK